MACYFCRHFRRRFDWSDPESDKHEWNTMPGECRRYPQPVEVRGDHYCWELRFEDPELPRKWRERIDELWVEGLDLRAERRELRAKLKEARRKLRELRQQGGAKR